MIPKPTDTQNPYVKLYSVCIGPMHILLYALDPLQITYNTLYSVNATEIVAPLYH